MKILENIKPSNELSIFKFRLTGIILLTIVCSALCGPALYNLLDNPVRSEYYSHILYIPLISAYLFFLKRDSIKRNAQYSGKTGLAVTVAGVVLYCISWVMQGKTSQNDHTSLLMMSTLIIWAGGFLILYGKRVFRYAAFPVIFLLFMVPFPDSIMESAIHILRVGSAEAANGIFTLAGIPFERTGFSFHFSTLSVEVAKECSGIRSFIALFITSVLAGDLFLRSTSAKCLLLLFVAPIAMFKNGIRIATLSLMGNYIDRRVLESDLHRKGGVLFFVIALILVGMIIGFLKKTEGRYFMKQKKHQQLQQ